MANAKRQRMDDYDILCMDNIEVSDDQWLDAVSTIIEKSDVVDRLIKRKIAHQRQSKTTKKSYVSHGRSNNLWTSSWGTMLKNPQVSVVDSWENRKLRRRFRVPHAMFLEIVAECKEHDVFCCSKRKSKIAIEFKVLSCLRIIERDICADEIDETLNIAESTVNKFFKQFLFGYAEVMFTKWVYVPEGAELDALVDVYRRMGFPGCVGSMDVTHIFWDKCPKRLRFLCKGKEGIPSLAFQAVVEHSRRIQHISKPFYGATNDITITYQDTYPMKLMTKQVHADRIFQTYNRDGERGLI